MRCHYYHSSCGCLADLSCLCYRLRSLLSCRVLSILNFTYVAYTPPVAKIRKDMKVETGRLGEILAPRVAKTPDHRNQHRRGGPGDVPRPPPSLRGKAKKRSNVTDAYTTFHLLSSGLSRLTFLCNRAQWISIVEWLISVSQANRGARAHLLTIFAFALSA
jgi:hypothetical protein